MLVVTGHDGKDCHSINDNQLTARVVFPWDTSDHKYGYDLWLKGVLADGGRRCQAQCDKEGEPLIEGMLVGTKKDELNVVEGEVVG